MLQGGMSTGKHAIDTCDLVTKIDNPSRYNCHGETPFVTQVKFLGSYPVPFWGLQLSGTFQHMRPEPTGAYKPSATGVFGMRALYVATNAVIAPSLGRALSAGAPNATIDLLESKPGLYLDYINQLDFRVAKTLNLRGAKLQGLLDVFNVFNGNSVLRYNTAYGTNGASWLVPTAALPGRLIRFGAQFNF